MASINGATQVRAGAIRPEIFIEGKNFGSGQAIQDYEGLDIGARIRGIRAPFFGIAGTVTELPFAAEKIETGAKTRVLRMKLDSGETVTVPRANVELIT